MAPGDICRLAAPFPDVSNPFPLAALKQFLSLDEPVAPAPQGASVAALLAFGFRPFYLLAALQASISLALWALQWTGVLPWAYLGAGAWHAHEMLFGFALAVIVGFLYTAGKNWTNQPTPTGAPLAALCALWLAGRLLVLSPWPLLSAVVNTLFPLAAAAGLVPALWRSRNQRNYFFVPLLVLMAVAQLLVHLPGLGVPVRQGVGLALGMDIVMIVMAVMAGRVVPMFTRNTVPTSTAQRHEALDRVAIVALVALALADSLAGVLPPLALALLATAAAVLHGARWLLWRPWQTLRHPLLWVLHLAYGFIVAHLALRAAASLQWLPSTMAIHALTAGAMGLLIIGMMTRTARGHTGRPLRADGAETAMYLLVLGAALLRVAAPVMTGIDIRLSIGASALLWSAAFAAYFVRYAPWLASPRVDGRPG